MQVSVSMRNAVSAAVLVLVAVVLCWALDGVLTDKPITGDALQNLRAAHNVYAHGVFSTASPASGRPRADNYREPTVPLAASLAMRMHAKHGAEPAFEEFSRGRLCRSIKRINIAWALVLLLGTGVLGALLTRSTAAAALCAVLTYAVFLRNPEHLDTLCTEIPTAAFMMWTSVLLTMCARSGGRPLFFCAGLLCGLLCLTKAVFLYLAIPAALGIFCWSALSAHMKKIRALSCCVLFMAGVTVAAGPWMLRNYVHFGSFTLTLRGGAVLYGRTLRDTMTMDEVVGALYLWGPGAYRKLVKGTFLDMGPEDFREGGKAARINRSPDSDFALRDTLAEEAGAPGAAISFHSRGRAQRMKLIRHFASQGNPNPQIAADRHLAREARRWILEHPVRHALMSILFAWRGVWCFYGGGVFTGLNALCYCTFIALAVLALITGRMGILAGMLLPFLMLCFNAFLTHNLSRYSAPAIPHLVTSLVVLTVVRSRGRRGKPRYVRRQGPQGLRATAR